VTTTAQAFTTFQDAISATDYQRNTIVPARKRTVDDRLYLKFPSTSDLPYAGSLLMGSASKGTIIRPVDDVDVLAIFSNVNDAWNKYQYDSKSFIYRVRDAYSGISIQQVGTRGQAVRVFYDGGGHVDVAPVFSQGNDVYHLPNGTGGWIRTAPMVANAWYANRSKELNYQLSPVVRLLKAWNRAHSKRMQSYHLESVAAKVFSVVGINHRTALQVFFEAAPRALSVSDPGGQGGDLSTYLTWSAQQSLVQAFNTAAERSRRANEAESRGDHAEAKRLWHIVLGDGFATA
jgi:hypothetical protein